MTPDDFYAQTLEAARAHLARLPERPQTPAMYREVARTALEEQSRTLPWATVGPVVAALGGAAVVIVRIACALAGNDHGGIRPAAGGAR